MSSRREIIKTLVGATGMVAGAPAQEKHQHPDPKTDQAATKPLVQVKAPRQVKFFTKEEFETLGVLVDLIIPRTDTPGAKDADVHYLIDERVPRDPARQAQWRNGFSSLDKSSRARYKSRFADLPASQQIELLTAMSKEKNAPRRVFFELVKGATVDGYYETKEGLGVELGWHGNTYLTEFPGCTHPEHKT